MKKILENWRKLLLEREVFGMQNPDDTYEFKLKIYLPFAARAREGDFIGLDRLKNDIRGLSDVTVVNTLASERDQNGIMAMFLVKFSMRLMPGKNPGKYVKNQIIPDIVELFNVDGGFAYEGRPRIVWISDTRDKHELPMARI